MIKWILSGLLVAFIVFTARLLTHVGAFKSVQINETISGPYLLLAKDHVGSYHKIVSVIEEVETWAKSKGYKCNPSFGQYLDNPDKVEDERRRSRGGCILESRIEEFPQDFTIIEIPAKKYIRAEFSGAPSIGPMKVYPKVIAYAEDKKILLGDVVTELYEIKSGSGADSGTESKSENEMTTTYLFEVVP